MALAAIKMVTSNAWMVDYTSTPHNCRNGEFFKSMKKMEYIVKVGNMNELAAVGIVAVVLNSVVEEINNNLELHDALYSPGMM